MTALGCIVILLAGFAAIGAWAAWDQRRADRDFDRHCDTTPGLERDIVFDLTEPVHELRWHPSRGWYIHATYAPGDVAAGAERILLGRDRG